MKYFLYLFAAIMLISCNDEMVKSYESKPIALARMNEIIVIADDDMWDSPVRDTFSYYFEGAYPIMPTPEPMFDVRHFTPNQLVVESLRKELRTYIILADLSDKDSPTSKIVRGDLGEERYQRAKTDDSFHTSVGKDKWARGQIVIYIFGNSKRDLYKQIRTNYPAIAKRIQLHDKDQLDASIYVMKNENPGIKREIQERLGLDIRIPGDYTWLKQEEENFMWFKKDTKEAAMNVIIRKFPYKSTDQMSVENIIEMRDDYGKRYISSPQPGSYMVTNTVDLPVYDYTYDIGENYTKEVRGIWEMENDFLGGPYASYLIHNNKANEVVFVDTWVYSPGREKRNMMMQLDYIVKTISF